MARQPKPVRPLRKHERSYERDIKRLVLAPLRARLMIPIARAEVLREELINEINSTYNEYSREELRNRPNDVAEAHINEVNVYQRAALVASFRSSLGVDVNPFLMDAQTQVVLQMRIRENVELIKSVPAKFHDELIVKMTETIEKHGFDQQQITKTLNNRFAVAGNRAKLIARDQVSKTIGSLTRVRNQQIGIQEYEWVTSHDERVRSSHAMLSGTRHRWDTPPPETGHPGHSIQCRCVARPIIEGIEL